MGNRVGERFDSRIRAISDNRILLFGGRLRSVLMIAAVMSESTIGGVVRVLVSHNGVKETRRSLPPTLETSPPRREPRFVDLQFGKTMLRDPSLKP